MNNNEKIIDLFKKDINIKIAETSDDFFADNNMFMKISAGSVMITSLFWIIYTLFSESPILEKIGFTSVIIQFVLALVVFLICFVKTSNSNNIMFIVTLTYDTLLIITTTMLVIEKNIQLADKIGESKVRSGIPLAAFYYFLIIITPLSKMKYSYPILILLVISAFVPMLFKGNNVYSITDNLILRVYIVTMYYFYYKKNTKIFEEKQISQKLDKELITLSLQDALTGSLNKRALYEYTNKISLDRNVKTIGTVIFDIDNFKSYNDTYGHMNGDIILEKICKIASDILSEHNLYLFRYGGEEFVFYICNPSLEYITEIGTKIRKSIYDENIKRNDISSGRITITCGAAIQNTIREENVDYVQKADAQLYIGKSASKNCFVIENKTYR